MKRTYSLHITLVFLLVMTMFSFAQKGSKLGLSSTLPMNPKVKVGMLENGLTYYIMKNQKPENRMELRLAVNAGSVLETDEQQGLAHFFEHMCFNGTKNFRKDALVKYLESIGVRFGADLNAYTSFDETVYMLQVPTDKDELMNKGFQVLEDWAHNVSLENEEIDKERGVILEELRLGKGAGMRIRDKQFPIMFKNSKYANRLPIGIPEVLKNFKYETLKSFYRDWYRPDLMAVIAIGDFDEKLIEKKIKEHFSKIDQPKKAPVRASVPVPDHNELLFAIATDPEATSTSVGLMIKHDKKPVDKVIDYRRGMMENLYQTMINDRFQEIMQQSDPPFVQAYANYGSYVRTKDVYMLGATVKEGGVLRGLGAALTEAIRVERHGFTETELDRAKTNLLRGVEKQYNEREKSNSSGYAREFVSNYLTGEPMPGIEIEYELHKKYLPTITLAELNKFAKELMTDKNRVLTLSAPEKKDVPIPSESELRAVLDEVGKKNIEPYVDKVSLKPLAEVTAAGSKVVNEKKIDEVGITEWTLANGIKVVMKPTEFKNDEIQFSASSPGGASLLPDKDQLSAMLAPTILQICGLGEFDKIQLKKVLTGKVATVSPWLSEIQEGFSGSCSPKDVETAFQLMYLTFTAPRKDTTAYNAFYNQTKTMMQNMGSMPESVFRDTLSVTLAQHHPRRRPVNVARLEELNLDKALEIYKERFSDASDFTFYFVGNFETEKLKPLVEKYLGALPVTNRKETWKETGIYPPKGIVEREVKKGIEQKSTVTIVFTGPAEWNYPNRYNFSSLQELLNMKLREEIREEKGGTYGVGVRCNLVHYPHAEYSVMVQFGCNPERVEELTKTAFGVFKKLIENEPKDEDVAKIKEIQKRERETSMKENSFWLGRIQSIYTNGDQLSEIAEFNTMVEGLSPKALRETAAKYIRLDNYVRCVMLPEKQEEKK